MKAVLTASILKDMTANSQLANQNRKAVRLL